MESQCKINDAPNRDGYSFVCWKGSEYQPGQKYLADSDHTFIAQWKKNGSDQPDDPTDPDIDNNDNGSGTIDKRAKTGDESNPIMWIAMMVVSAAAVTALIARRRHRRN